MREQTGEKINPTIVHEDANLLVINKPAGWIVNDTNTAHGQPTIQEWLRRNFQFPIFEFREYRNGIVHRLDKETSGVLLIAKTPEYFEKLQNLFRDRLVSKKYVALVHGLLKEPTGTIEVEVGRLPWNRQRFGVVPGGRSSLTRYELDGVYRQGEKIYSLVNFFPKTGRTHQIRIHAKYIGNAIVADPFYAGRKTARKDRIWCNRIFLHAMEIRFVDPATQSEVVYSAPLADDLKSALSILEKAQ